MEDEGRQHSSSVFCRKKEYRMSRRRRARPSNRQILAVVAIILALLGLTGLWDVPWLIFAVILLALAHLI
jgi:hypothetical protein